MCGSFLHVSPRCAVKTVPVKIFGRFRIGFAFASAFLVVVPAFLAFAVFSLLFLALAFALPVGFALLPMAFTSIERSMGTTPPAPRSVCARQ